MQRLYSVLSVFLIFTVCITSATGIVDTADQLAVPLAEEDAAEFLEKVDLTMIEYEPNKPPIYCFNVSDSGVVAIGCGDAKSKSVRIYSSDGYFNRCYLFNCDGGFGLGYDKSDLMIYFVRSDIAIKIDQFGNVKCVLKVFNSSENQNPWIDSIYSKEKCVNGCKYSLTNTGISRLFNHSYTQLKVLDQNGNETVIYEADEDNYQINYLLLILALVSVLLLFVYFFIKEKQKTQKTENRPLS